MKLQGSMGWSQVRRGVIFGVSTAVLAACGGYKSKIYSPAEVQAYIKAHPGVNPLANAPATSAPLPNSPSTKPATSTASDPDSSNKVTTTPSAPALPMTDADGSKSKVMIEVNPNDFFKVNEAYLKDANHTDPARLLRGISFHVTPGTNGVMLQMDAVVVFENLPQQLSLEPSLVSTVKQTDVPFLQLTLKPLNLDETSASGKGQTNLGGNQVSLMAACTADDCHEVQARLTFEDDKGPVFAVFRLQYAGSQYVMQGNSLQVDPVYKTFQEAEDELKTALVAGVHAWAEPYFKQQSGPTALSQTAAKPAVGPVQPTATASSAQWNAAAAIHKALIPGQNSQRSAPQAAASQAVGPRVAPTWNAKDALHQAVIADQKSQNLLPQAATVAKPSASGAAPAAASTGSNAKPATSATTNGGGWLQYMKKPATTTTTTPSAPKPATQQMSTSVPANTSAAQIAADKAANPVNPTPAQVQAAYREAAAKKKAQDEESAYDQMSSAMNPAPANTDPKPAAQAAAAPQVTTEDSPNFISLDNILGTILPM